MRIVFMGTPRFAVPILERLIGDGHEILAVYSQPDKPAGRGYRLAPTPVKELALRSGIEVRQPVKLRDGAVAAELRGLAPELAVVAAYGRLLPKDVLEAPRMGCVNLHASLLPRHRGAAPIQWSILSGDTVTGVTGMCMAEGLDTGDILLSRETPIGENETAPELSERLSALGAACVSDLVRLLGRGDAARTPQDSALATLAPPLEKGMGLMDFTRPARELHCLVRGLAGWPSAYTRFGGKLLKIHRSAIVEGVEGVQGAPGEVVDGKRLIVACGEGALELCEVQLEGRQRVPGEAFMRGQRINSHGTFMNR